MMFEARQESTHWVAEIHLEQLTQQVAASFQKVFTEAVSQYKGPVILDLSRVKFMDSSGIAALVFCFQSLALKENLLLCGACDRVTRSLSISNLDKVLNIFPNQNQALSWLNQRLATAH